MLQANSVFDAKSVVNTVSRYESAAGCGNRVLLDQL